MLLRLPLLGVMKYHQKWMEEIIFALVIRPAVRMTKQVRNIKWKSELIETAILKKFGQQNTTTIIITTTTTGKKKRENTYGSGEDTQKATNI